ncbi:protein of unknown function [Paenibacillus alvei]|uniref:Uncharacterized protein n=1 Tax=Paenibacillus alvei TaxID=44250 RepID=A0A383RAJ9_PAEAL|nr:protein of unknown function [Paenibacillus alvei]
MIGAKRYRYLPADFEERREENHKALKQPHDSEAFIASLKQVLPLVVMVNALNS